MRRAKQPVAGGPWSVVVATSSMAFFLAGLDLKDVISSLVKYTEKSGSILELHFETPYGR